MEERVRAVIERLTGAKFPESSPPFAGGLCLGGYNAPLRLAFEYFGPHHYKVTPQYHPGGEADLKAQQKRDARVQALCAEAGVRLVVVPYTVANLPAFVSAALAALKAAGDGPPQAAAPAAPAKTCVKCGARFATNQKLQRHLSRTRPCEPVVATPAGDLANPRRCRYCGRVYSRSDSLARHQQKACRVRGDPGGAEQVFDFALRLQQERAESEQARLESERARLESERALADERARRAQLEGAQLERLERLERLQPQKAEGGDPRIQVMNNIQVNNVLVSFGDAERAGLPAAVVAAAFTENPRLVEYCRMSDSDRVDADKAAPFVLEALLELVRRVHQDPARRNIKLNPRRADQVMVRVGADQRWEVRGLGDVIRTLFDEVSGSLRRVVLTDGEREQLPFEVQSAAAWVPGLYEDEPERFVREARGRFAAHLTNVMADTSIMAYVVEAAAGEPR